MLTIAFWNVARKPLGATVAGLALEWDVDIFVVCESPTSTDATQTALSQASQRPWHTAFAIGRGIVVYTRLHPRFLQTRRELPNALFLNITLPLYPDFLLAAVHLRSKLHAQTADQAAAARKIVRELSSLERDVGHQRTIALGDFNMDPFEEGMLSADAFHGVMSRDIALRHTRRVAGDSYGFFYNPMWGFIGRSSTVPGTYYYDNSGAMVNQYWHVYDQLIVRPNVAPWIDDARIRILTMCGPQSLIAPNGCPDAGAASDHLPIVFSIDPPVEIST
jgi:hypothetical protein